MPVNGMLAPKDASTDAGIIRLINGKVRFQEMSIVSEQIFIKYVKLVEKVQGRTGGEVKSIW